MNPLTKIQQAEAQFLERVKESPGSFRMPGVQYPWSVTPAEGRWLYEMARLCAPPGHAYEIATAFGYSALWIAAGLSSIGHSGLLTTMDSYVEEESSDQVHDLGVNRNPKGFRMATQMAQFVGLANIDHCIGSSPEAVNGALAAIRIAPIPGVISLVFIDGHHLNGQPSVDWEAIKPWLNKEKAIVVFHDTHVPDVKVALAKCEEWMGRSHFNPHLPGFSIVSVVPVGFDTKLLERAAARCKDNPYA